MKIFQGIDIVNVDRVKKLSQKTIQRIFTQEEIKFCESKKEKAEHYAAHFAAKEAFFKAIDIGENEFLAFKDIEICHRPTGKPYISLSGRVVNKISLPKPNQIEISLTHERKYAVAAVIVVTF